MKSIRIISMLLAVLVITCTLQIHGTVVVNAEGFDNLNATEKVEQKIPFADNRVLVVLTNEESLKFSKYSVSSFPELSCSKVTNLTEESDKLLKAQIYGDSVKTVSEIPQLFTVNKNTYRTILYVELNNSGYNEVAKAIKILSQHEGVQSAEPDFYLTIPDTNAQEIILTEPREVIPADMYYADQWGLQKIQMPDAWEYTEGAPYVNVAVIDTGINQNHPDLSNRVNSSLSGYISDGQFVSVATATDPNGHGTHVAGIIAANKNNGIGIAGIASGIKLVSLKYTEGASGVGLASNAIKAIDYARIMNIPIINFSSGYNTTSSNYEYYFNTTPSAFNTVIENYPGLFVCSAGNNGVNIDVTSVYPACCTSNKVIVVAPSTASDTRSSSSNYGRSSVDLFAPGDSIMSTTGNTYAYMSGTSMAAPHVTGVAALLLSRNNTLSAVALKTRIMNNVDSNSAFSAYCVSGGRLNAYKAIINSAG